MDLKELLKKQSELDKFIIESKGLQNLEPKTRLTNTLLAWVVEIAELSNEIRCFKHWSEKLSSDKAILLDEYADTMHFMASVANQLRFTSEDIENAYNTKYEVNKQRQREGY